MSSSNSGTNLFRFPGTEQEMTMNTRDRIAARLTFATLGLVALLADSAGASLVLHLPLDDGPDGAAVNTASAAIDDAGHPTTFGTSNAGGGDTWFNDPTRGIVYRSVQGQRLTAGTQGIDRNVGFTWSVWVNVDSAAAGNSDGGADVLIGTRQADGGAWNKVQITGIQNWASIGGYDVGDATWHHLAYLGDNTSVRFYIDGVFIDQDTTTPSATFNANFEIGGSATFSEDSEGLFSDVGVWNEALTADEVVALFDVGNTPHLMYDVGQFDLLKQIHDAGSGSVEIGDLTWSYAEGLSGDAGVTGGILVLDAGAGTGLVAVGPVPEPSSFGLAALGAAGLMRARRRRRR